MPTEGETSKLGEVVEEGNEIIEKETVQQTLVQQLFTRITQEIESNNPSNIISFIVGFLCKHYHEHLPGFSSIFNADPDLEFERLAVVEFFRAQKMPVDVAAHFTSAGFDTLETLSTVNTETLDDIERFNQTNWLPGHKVRLQQVFSDIAGRIKSYRDEKEFVLKNTQQAYYPSAHYTSMKPAVTPTSSLRFPAQLAAPTYRFPNPAGTFQPPLYTTSKGGYPANPSNSRN
ncbi:hypothetical protein IE077_001048 [Cardiosporidium cionae]|uniref:Uncharacterized protein n=1 Tax=Cardiosporidium cionae TaxID=476202 RepID=A0ABQ7J625_9APIC|nr:hypothetical protein IE077_001048 [Cardiosporidium cionae]|eukprot:KAF8819427.1 hypothetical protein IE077_001048 [Cardiosporidium cionae]